MINWNARFNASSSNTDDDIQTIMLRGVLIDSTVNSNGWQIEEVDLADIAEQSIGAQLRLDHSPDVRRVKGQILEAEIDGPHDEDKGPHDPANTNVHIHFTAEVVTDDPALIIPITRGYVNKVSIGADAKTVYCSNCGKPTRPIKRCGCKSHEILKDIIVREYSIVTTPAYESAVFTPFAAAVDKYLEDDIMNEENLDHTVSDGATVHVTSDTTNINYFNSTNGVSNTPDVVTTDLTGSTTTFVASEKEESEELKKEELKEVEAEVDHKVDPNEAPKDFIVNVNKDEIKDPGVIDKAEDEDDNMDEDKTENKIEDRLEALTASLEKLVASLTAVKAEAEEDEEKEKVEAEEDEDEKVEAMDGHPFKEKNVDSGSPPNPTGAEPEVHDAPDKYPVDEKDIKIPKKTPAMGVSAGLISTGKIGIDVETGSVNEIFGFAAKHQI